MVLETLSKAMSTVSINQDFNLQPLDC